MNFDTVVKLIKCGEPSKYEYGNTVYTEKIVEVFAEKKAIWQSEFFQAHAAGFKPEIILEIYSFEYHNEELCELDGERYRIYRFYHRKKGRTELYLTSIVGENDAFA
jgi:SPP1 family predicted phage head-tail adaptor